MRGQFSLFQTPLDLAKGFWKACLKPGSIAIDATCGNGYDTLFLCQNIPSCQIFAIDIQKEAIEKTKDLIIKELRFIPPTLKLFCQSHESFPEEIRSASVDLILYNLGYLPGSDKTVKTGAKSTLKSIHNALLLLKPSGLLSITCYSGHREGQAEEEQLKEFFTTLSPQEYCYTHFFFPNRNKAPSLILVQKSCS